jgi:hypothetical protein
MDDAAYEKSTIRLALEMQEKDPTEAEALMTLSKWGYEDYWQKMKVEGENYTCQDLGSGEYRIHRTGASVESPPNRD